MNHTKGLILRQKFPSIFQMQQGVATTIASINKCTYNNYNCAHHNIFFIYKKLKY